MNNKEYPYGFIYFGDWLPENCAKCLFNYDKKECIVCNPQDDTKRRELEQCLNEMYKTIDPSAIYYDRRYSGCPLRALRGRLFSVPEVASLFRISRQAVWKMIKSGKIEACKIGKNYKISQNELEKLKGVK